MCLHYTVDRTTVLPQITMLSASTIILQYVFPGLGTITGHLMWFAPWHAIHRAVSAGTLGNLNPLPWAFMLGNCIGWVTYGILTDDYFIFFANIFGFLLSVHYNMQAVKLQFHMDRSFKEKQSIVTALKEVEEEQQSKSLLMNANVDDAAAAAISNEGDIVVQDDDRPAASSSVLDYAKIVWEVAAQKRQSPAPHEKAVLFMVVLWVATISLVIFGDSFTDTAKQNIVGYIVIANLVFFYGAPLSVIFTVLSTRNSGKIHIPTMLTTTANGVFWCAYGVAVSDYLIAGPNGAGAALGGVQMLLVCVFPRGEEKSESAEEKAPEMRVGGVGEVANGEVQDDVEAVESVR